MATRTDNITSLPDLRATPRLSEAQVSSVIDNYIRNVVNGAITPPEAGNLLSFFKLVKNAIGSRQAAEGIAEDKRLLFMVDDPPDEKAIDTEAITFVLDQRLPGAFGRMSATGSKAGMVREVTPHCRSVVNHPEHPGEKLVTMGRLFDNYITFNIYARTNLQAMKRVLWFEDVLDTFSWYFRLHRIRAIGQGAKRIGSVAIGDLTMVKYSMSVLVRTEDTYQFGVQELKKLIISLNVSHNENWED